ncbi:protein of unknown function [Candidatus Nitrosotalea okcheonensis]|uniref:Uncharacterized protein n=1 Tax=Candidatus Nitrosotalea okcheonensis TaxID=1903276 RepID=A0A2H1FDS9_9ARCH|nr:protein of unknown function [Candidatus Nitrosotalea okcheonensis]
MWKFTNVKNFSGTCDGVDRPATVISCDGTTIGKSGLKSV